VDSWAQGRTVRDCNPDNFHTSRDMRPVASSWIEGATGVVASVHRG
jgi:hypothetical protein